MVVTFNEEYLEKLYTKGETGVKKLRFQPQIVRGYLYISKPCMATRRDVSQSRQTISIE